MSAKSSNASLNYVGGKKSPEEGFLLELDSTEGVSSVVITNSVNKFSSFASLAAFKEGGEILLQSSKKRCSGALLQGPRKFMRLCLFGFLIPVLLISIPLYVRLILYPTQMFSMAPTDQKLLNQHSSSVWCQAQTVKMNGSFNAYLMNKKPTTSKTFSTHTMLKHLTLKDDVKEYWGFYLQKGSIVTFNLCTRYDGGMLMIMKGVTNLRKCAWVGEEDSAEQDEDHMDTSSESGEPPEVQYGPVVNMTEEGFTMIDKKFTEKEMLRMSSSEKKQALEFYVQKIMRLGKNKHEVLQLLSKKVFPVNKMESNQQNDTEIPKMQTVTEIPKTQNDTEIPKVQTVTKIPKTQNGTKIPKTQNDTEIPKTQNGTEIPKTQNDTEIPKMQTVTETPKTPNDTEIPKTLYDTELPKTQNDTEIPTLLNVTVGIKVQNDSEAEKIQTNADSGKILLRRNVKLQTSELVTRLRGGAPKTIKDPTTEDKLNRMKRTLEDDIAVGAFEIINDHDIYEEEINHFRQNSSMEMPSEVKEKYLSLFHLPSGLSYVRGKFNQTHDHDTSNDEERSSFSSSEEALTKCSGLQGLIPLFQNRQCNSFNDTCKNRITYKIPSTGTYFFVFSSDNEVFASEIYFNMTLQKVVFDTENATNSCHNETSCSLPFSFWSHDQAIVEVPEGDWDSAYTLEVICKPRVTLYLGILIFVPILFLFCALQ